MNISKCWYPQHEVDLKKEENLKNKDGFKNVDDFNNEDDLKTDVDPTNEETLKQMIALRI